jgi:hypothetical protein
MRELRGIFTIAARNLLRYRRRTLLTASLVVVGVMFVLVYVARSPIPCWGTSRSTIRDMWPR